MATLTSKEFEDLSRFIMDTAGIQLEKGKEYLMEARLEPILERYGLDTFGDLYLQAISDATGKLKASIIDAITINETYFFRDNTPFDLLKNKIMPDIIDRKTAIMGKQRISIKVWSAACSTGQEVYSLAMTFKEMRLDAEKLDISILGTDISNEAIAKASYGKYNQFEIDRGLGSYFLNRYFTPVSNGWRIKDEIRAMARFAQMDLNQPFKGVGTFDVILCRNVAIYFPLHGKIKLFQQLANSLNHGGALIVGGSESLAGLTTDFIPRHYLNGVFYQLRSPDAAKKRHAPELSPYGTISNPPPAKTPSPPPKPQAQKIPTRAVQDATSTRIAEIQKQMSEKPEEVSEGPPSPPSAPKAEHREEGSLLESIQARSGSQTSTSSIIQKPEKTSKKSLLEQLKEKEKEQADQ